MKKILLYILFCLPLMVGAQTKDKGYYIIPGISMLNGDEHIDVQAQIAGGFKLKNGLQLGAGAALDLYKIRTVPVFADLRYSFAKNGENSFFVYANAGYNIPWAKDKQHRSFIPGNIVGVAWLSRFTGGVYTDIGVGDEIRLNKRRSLAVSLGYSVKTQQEYYTSLSIWSFRSTLADEERKAEYIFRRLSFRIGISL